MIRSYADADLEEVLDAWYEASIVAHSFLPADFFVAERDEMIRRWIPNSETHVYELAGGRVVGFISLIADEVGAIFVRPDHQGHGIGRALMDHARSLRASLELDVFEENSSGRRFYAAYGFEPVSTHTDEATGRVMHRLRLA